MEYLSILEGLNSRAKNVAKLVGVSQSFVSRILSGQRNFCKNYTERYQIHIRFLITLCLSDTINEIDLAVISKRYKISKGCLQSIQQMASVYAGKYFI